MCCSVDFRRNRSPGYRDTTKIGKRVQVFSERSGTRQYRHQFCLFPEPIPTTVLSTLGGSSGVDWTRRQSNRFSCGLSDPLWYKSKRSTISSLSISFSPNLYPRFNKNFYTIGVDGEFSSILWIRPLSFSVVETRDFLLRPYRGSEKVPKTSHFKK